MPALQPGAFSELSNPTVAQRKTLDSPLRQKHILTRGRCVVLPRIRLISQDLFNSRRPVGTRSRAYMFF